LTLGRSCRTVTTSTTNTEPSKMTLSIGTKIKSANIVWTVVSCGNGFYGIRAEGSARTMTIRCEEALADVEAGRAIIL
jgi:hypothetical protein